MPGAIGLVGITEIVGENADAGSENFLSALVSVPSIALAILVGTMIVRAVKSLGAVRVHLGESCAPRHPAGGWPRTLARVADVSEPSRLRQTPPLPLAPAPSVTLLPSLSPSSWRPLRPFPRGLPLTQPPVGPDAASAPPPRHHRPWGWIAACVLLVLVAGGLAIWALGLQTDLDDQRDQTAQAQQQAEQAANDVEALAGEVDQISQSVSDAGDQLSQAGGDAEKNAQQALDGLDTKLQSLKGNVQEAIEDSGASQDSSAP